MNLLLLSHNLLVQQIYLLCRDRVFGALGLFARSRGLPSNVIEGFFAVRSELRVFELPGLKSKYG